MFALIAIDWGFFQMNVGGVPKHYVLAQRLLKRSISMP